MVYCVTESTYLVLDLVMESDKLQSLAKHLVVGEKEKKQINALVTMTALVGTACNHDFLNNYFGFNSSPTLFS